jgi:hypothetical protein
MGEQEVMTTRGQQAAYAALQEALEVALRDAREAREISQSAADRVNAYAKCIDTVSNELSKSQRERNELRRMLAERGESVSLPINPEHDALVDRLVEERVRGTGRALATVPVLALPSVEVMTEAIFSNWHSDTPIGAPGKPWAECAAEAVTDLVRESQPAELRAWLALPPNERAGVRDMFRNPGWLHNAARVAAGLLAALEPKGNDHE